MKTLYIICNSPRALNAISSGKLKNLDEKDIFTCNNAYTFFKTSGKHYNFWTDVSDIFRHIKLPEQLSDNYHLKVKHVYNKNAVFLKDGRQLFRNIFISPIDILCSSGMGALCFASVCLDYNRLVFVGHTLVEKQETYDFIDNNFVLQSVSFNYCIYEYKRKKDKEFVKDRNLYLGGFYDE